MREFCELTFGGPFFPEPAMRVVLSNIDGDISAHSDDSALLNNLIEDIGLSSARADIAKEGSGLEYILSGRIGVGGRYSSDNSFTEDEFKTASSKMKFMRVLKA